MSSLREQILEYLVGELNEIVGVSAQRSRVAPARRENGVAVIVTPIDEQPTQEVGFSYQRELNVRISVLAFGEIPDQVADPYAVAIYAKLMATHTTRTLGGLASLPLVDAGRVFLIDDADGGAAIEHQMTFTVTYRTALTDEATAA